jgi:hypothetical protein
MLLGLVLLSGCSQFINPFKDGLANAPEISTPSTTGVQSGGVRRAGARRSHTAQFVTLHDGSVTHGPLLFEAPNEESADHDDQFAWTREDYLHPFLWRGRFLLNLAALPVSEAMTPPWMTMQSDGVLQPNRIGEYRDAAPAHSGGKQPTEQVAHSDSPEFHEEFAIVNAE